MKVPLAATLICLCGAASAATCDTATHPVQPQAAQPAAGLILATMALPGPTPSPAARPALATAGTDEPRRDERGLLLAGIALMAAIALRRSGGPQ